MKRHFLLLSLFNASALSNSFFPTGASAAEIKEITLTVERATTNKITDINVNPFSKDEKPDLFTTVAINGNSTSTSQTVSDRLDASFNFAVTEQIAKQSPTKSYPIKIQLFDRDKFGDNKEMDIHPMDLKDLNITYFPQSNGSGTVSIDRFSDARGFNTFRSGDLIKLTGACQQKFGCGIPATIYFRVSHR